MGVGLILRLLEKSATRVRGSFLVSGWDGLLGSEEFDPLIESFFATPFNFQTIRNQLGTTYMYHGDNDPYVPLEMAKDLASKLEVELTVIPGGGHLNKEAGYASFPRLFDDIYKLIGTIK